MAREEEEHRDIINWASEKSWTLQLIREFNQHTDASKFPFPERIGLRTLPTNDTFRHYCRYW